MSRWSFAKIGPSLRRGQEGKEGPKNSRSFTPGQVSSVGVPQTRKMRKSSSISESPLKMGVNRTCGRDSTA